MPKADRFPLENIGPIKSARFLDLRRDCVRIAGIHLLSDVQFCMGGGEHRAQGGIATAKRKTLPMTPRSLLAVSLRPLFSYRLRIMRISAGVISAIGLLVSGDARSSRSQRTLVSFASAAPFSFKAARCSSAIAPKVLFAAVAATILSSFFCCDGSLPSASQRSSARAASSDNREPMQYVK